VNRNSAFDPFNEKNNRSVTKRGGTSADNKRPFLSRRRKPNPNRSRIEIVFRKVFVIINYLYAHVTTTYYYCVRQVHTHTYARLRGARATYIEIRVYLRNPRIRSRGSEWGGGESRRYSDVKTVAANRYCETISLRRAVDPRQRDSVARTPARYRVITKSAFTYANAAHAFARTNIVTVPQPRINRRRSPEIPGEREKYRLTNNNRGSLFSFVRSLCSRRPVEPGRAARTAKRPPRRCGGGTRTANPSATLAVSTTNCTT